MTTIHLLDAHKGGHRVKRPTLRRRIADAFPSVWEWLRTTECLLPPAPMTGIALVPPVPFGVTAQPAEDNPPAGEWAQTTALDLGSHPYPPMTGTVLSRDLGDGWVTVDQNAHIELIPVRPGKQPWLTAAQPALGEPTPAGLPRLGEDPCEPLPADRLPPHIAAYFDEQNRALALGPDGCEET